MARTSDLCAIGPVKTGVSGVDNERVSVISYVLSRRQRSSVGRATDL